MGKSDSFRFTSSYDEVVTVSLIPQEQLDNYDLVIMDENDTMQILSHDYRLVVTGTGPYVKE